MIESTAQADGYLTSALITNASPIAMGMTSQVMPVTAMSAHCSPVNAWSKMNRLCLTSVEVLGWSQVHDQCHRREHQQVSPRHEFGPADCSRPVGDEEHDERRVHGR